MTLLLRSPLLLLNEIRSELPGTRMHVRRTSQKQKQPAGMTLVTAKQKSAPFMRLFPSYIPRHILVPPTPLAPKVQLSSAEKNKPQSYMRINQDKQHASSIPGGRGSPRRCSILLAIAAAVMSGLGLMNDVATRPCRCKHKAGRKEQGTREGHEKNNVPQCCRGTNEVCWRRRRDAGQGYFTNIKRWVGMCGSRD